MSIGPVTSFQVAPLSSDQQLFSIPLATATNLPLPKVIALNSPLGSVGRLVLSQVNPFETERSESCPLFEIIIKHLLPNAASDQPPLVAVNPDRGKVYS